MTPTDDELIAFLQEHPARNIKHICERFNLPYCYSATCPSPDGEDYGYTSEAKAILDQLQRLRMARRIRSEGQRWRVC